MTARIAKIDGLKEIKQALRKLPDRTNRRITRKALIKGGEVIQQAAEDHAPHRSGRLEKNIDTQSAKTGRIGGTSVQVDVGPTTVAFYGGFVERGQGNGAPHPFMRPALDEKDAEAVRVVGEELWKGIEKAARRKR